MISAIALALSVGPFIVVFCWRAGKVSSNIGVQVMPDGVALVALLGITGAKGPSCGITRMCWYLLHSDALPATTC